MLVSNYNGEDWPEEVRKDFVDYVRNGGGLVIVHAADNAFPGWPEYNEMIGIGACAVPGSPGRGGCQLCQAP